MVALRSSPIFPADRKFQLSTYWRVIQETEIDDLPRPSRHVSGVVWRPLINRSTAVEVPLVGASLVNRRTPGMGEIDDLHVRFGEVYGGPDIGGEGKGGDGEGWDGELAGFTSTYMAGAWFGHR